MSSEIPLLRPVLKHALRVARKIVQPFCDTGTF